MPRYFRGIAILLWLAVLVSGCAAQQQGKGRNPKAIRVPPGVTPLSAVRADSLAQQLFVSLADEKRATALVEQAEEQRSKSDSLLAILDRAAAERIPVSPEDSVESIKATLDGYQKVQKGTPTIQKYYSTQDEQLRQQAIYQLQEAEKSLVRAVTLNPYLPQARTLLGTVYKLLGDQFGDKTNYARAIDIWETLVRLEPGAYANYFYLGQNYFANQNWQKALENFERCEQTLLASAAVQDSRIIDPAQPVAAATDSTTLFYAVFYQSQSAIKLFDEVKSYASLRRALTLATTPQNRDVVESYLTWMDWDNGHIMGSMMRDSALALSSRGEFPKAAEIYEKTLPTLRSASARNEMGWLLATIEFANLSRKEYAAERMLKITGGIATDVNGTLSDSLNQRYLDNFGAMCLSLGNQNIEVDRKLAYTYYLQAASINWSGRGKSYFAMATLADNDPRQAVRDAEKAYDLADQLAPDELVNLHKLLIRGYRRLGEFTKAKFHLDELVRLQGGVSSDAPGL